jgi:hypothetical protein
MSPDAFIANWQGVTVIERASAQEHFIDLCRMLAVQTPADADPPGTQCAVRLREGCQQGARRGPVGRCLEAQALRLGVQGLGWRSQESLQATPTLQACPRIPS